jgi:hypothetical protein
MVSPSLPKVNPLDIADCSLLGEGSLPDVPWFCSTVSESELPTHRKGLRAVPRELTLNRMGILARVTVKSFASLKKAYPNYFLIRIVLFNLSMRFVRKHLAGNKQAAMPISSRDARPIGNIGCRCTILSLCLRKSVKRKTETPEGLRKPLGFSFWDNSVRCRTDTANGKQYDLVRLFRGMEKAHWRTWRLGRWVFRLH